MSVAPVFCRLSAVIAETAIGTSDSGLARRVAVTTISPGFSLSSAGSAAPVALAAPVWSALVPSPAWPTAPPAWTGLLDGAVCAASGAARPTIAVDNSQSDLCILLLPEFDAGLTPGSRKR